LLEMDRTGVPSRIWLKEIGGLLSKRILTPPILGRSWDKPSTFFFLRFKRAALMCCWRLWPVDIFASPTTFHQLMRFWLVMVSWCLREMLMGSWISWEKACRTKRQLWLASRRGMREQRCFSGRHVRNNWNGLLSP